MFIYAAIVVKQNVNSDFRSVFSSRTAVAESSATTRHTYGQTTPFSGFKSSKNISERLALSLCAVTQPILEASLHFSVCVGTSTRVGRERKKFNTLKFYYVF